MTTNSVSRTDLLTDPDNNPHKIRRKFAIIFVLGAPGAGKGTLCKHLSHVHNLVHFSVGDNLRIWMRANRHTPLAERIQQKLDRQGFLTSEDLNPFICQAIQDAIKCDGKINGILVDGFPRCVEQLESFDEWPFQVELPLVASKPDVVLLFSATKEQAKARCLARARDRNDSEEKFEERFLEYESESPPVEDTYRKRGLLIDINANGDKEENIKEMMRKLEESDLWLKTVVEEGIAQSFFSTA